MAQASITITDGDNDTLEYVVDFGEEFQPSSIAHLATARLAQFLTDSVAMHEAATEQEPAPALAHSKPTANYPY
ncbi:MAG: hypothetical protein WC997_02210 [Porticoccaceae bacterium]